MDIKLARCAAVVAWPAVIALSAQVDLAVPGSPVPISLQTLSVALAGLLLGPGWGTVAVLLYLTLAAAGLPVLAEGAAGLEVMLGPSVGYLAGFPLCALTAGLWRGRLGLELAGALGGQMLVLTLGVAGLVGLFEMTPGQAVLEGAMPYLPGMVAKAVAAALCSAAWRRLRR